MIHQIVHLAAGCMPAPTSDGGKVVVLFSVLLGYGIMVSLIAVAWFAKPPFVQTASRGRLITGLVMMPVMPVLVFVTYVFGFWAAASINSLPPV